ncbi:MULTISPECIES: phage baseplate assembly protein V [unclassified Acinetobacter]|uniref:phage baseplate assembly protein V n=1 Tax=unclassified Acinetobacter TaxID=196816 RepID=UPI00190989D0|nr:MULTISPECIES: phage baseplate assembly protein V [unclassified Acinetobacter]MBK0062620.1 phage baseplate assembly protein V [Acinetobacter sp. S55]MBK0065803.1 phage baseplate assembly protein V [Acinetobacter sp. S54]
MNISDIFRRLENIIRFGSINTVDLEHAFCTVNLGDITTAPLNWLNLRAGTDSTWDPPSVGERCIVFSPSGELAQGVVLFGIYSSENAAPTSAGTIKLRKFSDGTIIQYDTETHALNATLTEGGQVEITAAGGITLNGNTTINGNAIISGSLTAAGTTTINNSLTATGNITSNGDVKAGNISLSNHKHSGIQGGGSTSGGPVP